eukprot:216609_1
MTDLERIVNGALLVHLVIKEGQPLCKVKPFNDFYHGTFIEHKMGSNWYTTALIDAMDSWQRNQDKLDIFGPEGRSQFAMALDGSSKRARSVKIIDLRGWKRGHGPVTKYGLCLDAKKSLKDENVDLSDLFTTDTGKDNVETIEKVMAHYEISDWKQLIQLALDGALQNLGKWQGCGPNIQRKYNVFMWIEWCMTHRGNLLGKSGWKTIAYIQKHWDMQKLLYRTFSQKIMSQLYCGVCFLEEERAIAPKQDSETRFNSALKPTKNINKAWKTVAKTLKYVSAEQAECKQFRRQLNARTAGRNHPPPPPCPPVIVLYDYWGNLDRVVLNYVIELILCACESFGNCVGTTNKDIVSNYAEITQLESTLISFKTKNLRDFIELKQDEDTPKHTPNPIHRFMSKFSFDDARKIVRFGDHFQWTVSYAELNDRFKQRTSHLVDKILEQIPLYFEASKRDLMTNIMYLYDPKSFAAYSAFNETQNHENGILLKVFNAFKYVELPIGPNSSSFRKWTCGFLKWEQFKSEYMNVKLQCFQNRNLYPNDMSMRLKSIVFKMEEASNIFVMNLYVLQKVMICFSGVIDVERQNGIKKWMFNARQEGMLTQNMDKILRLFCNSPNPKDDVNLKPWIMECLKIFWSNAEKRQIECQQLDDICDKQ